MTTATCTLDFVESIIRNGPNYYPGRGRRGHTSASGDADASRLVTELHGPGGKVNAGVQFPYLLGGSGVAKQTQIAHLAWHRSRVFERQIVFRVFRV
jgi:hypothetical protein